MRKHLYPIIMFLMCTLCTGCYANKNSPLNDSQWIMTNTDQEGKLYYHHLILQPEHKVMLRSSYADSKNIIVWRGTYKFNSKKIIFNFEDCSRFENGKNVGQYKDTRLVKFYTGEFLYSLGLVEDEKARKDENGDVKKTYHLQLIRPKNQFYGENKDIYGNYLEEFVMMPEDSENLEK